MSVYLRFLFDFMSQLFKGIWGILAGIGLGILEIFNFPAYFRILQEYSNEFGVIEWILAGLAVIVAFALLIGLVFLFYLILRKYIRFRKTLVEQELMLEEIGKLNEEVVKLTQEKDRLYAMKVSQLGLKPGEEPIVEGEEDATVNSDDSRFFKLTQIDKEFENYKKEVTDETISLSELCDRFRNFAASKLKLYYTPTVVRLFLAAFSCTRLTILQGISGTGKTSMPYAWGKFLNNDAVIASVQPSWRDRTELFGYFNEFTKRFNETELLRKMYEASHRDIVYITILDEMNISRVEYYFAEMLSILEMPSRDEWVIDLVPTVWDNDPKKLEGGKLQIPPNMWYVGTINNDDSTFMVTDKVYDRAIPIDINDRGEPFDAPETEGIMLGSAYLESLFTKAIEANPVSEETLQKIEDLDKYVIQHFRIAFGNRILKQLKTFVPSFIACGGTELEGVDYIISHKILRKFEQLNLAFIRGEIDGLVKYFDQSFGKGVMVECREYLFRLKKSI